MGFLQMWRRYKMKRTLSKYLSPEVLTNLTETPKSQVGKIQAQHFQFVVVHIDEARPDEIPQVIAKVFAAFTRHKATLQGVTSSLVVGYFGIPYPESDKPETRLELVRTILTENGSHVRVAHGQCTGLLGTFGSEGRYNWGGIIPGFSEVLKKLFASEFGAEIPV
jgi:hypothetical protein